MCLNPGKSNRYNQTSLIRDNCSLNSRMCLIRDK